MLEYSKIIFFNDKNTPYQELSNLLHEAFKERLDSNLNFGCATFTPDELRRHTRDAYIVCFLYQDAPVAMGVLSVKKKNVLRYGVFEFLAVSPKEKYRGKGLGVQIQKECVQIAQKLGLELVTSCTAIEAESSVKTHLKTGFKIYRIKHYTERNYLSYCFYYPLKLSFFNVFLFLIRKPLVLITKHLIK